MVASPPSQATLQQVVDQILAARRITRADQSRVMAIALQHGCLNCEQQQQVDRIFDALKRGFVKVVD